MTLEAFIEDALQRLGAYNYVPHEFLVLRARLGLVPTIAQLVEGSEYKGGFLRTLELGLVDCSLEAAVTRHPDRFSSLTVGYARARLKGLFGLDRRVIEVGNLKLPVARNSEAIPEAVRHYLQYARELIRQSRLPLTRDQDRVLLSQLGWFWYGAAADLLCADSERRPRPPRRRTGRLQ